MRSKKYGVAAGLAAITLLICGVNTVFPENPGFLAGFFNPYFILAVFASVIYGKYHGLSSLLFSSLIIALGLPTAISIVNPASFPGYGAFWANLLDRAPLPLSMVLVETYLLGLFRDYLVGRDRNSRARLTAVSREKGLLLRQVRVLQTANLELEERISRQEDSITSLYEQIQALYSLNLDRAARAILMAVQRFVGATRCSIWEYKPENRSLELVGRLGAPEQEDLPTSIAVENTIEGWVVRNNMKFSVKMLIEYDSLARLDSGRNIVTIPISSGWAIWGVLNIEEMPFAKYNNYSERLLDLIMALSAPALERAIEYESVFRQEEIDPVTGLPSFVLFYSLLEKELSRATSQNGNMTIVILEVVNYQTLALNHGKEETQRLLARAAALAQNLGGARTRLFRYKTEGQLVLLCPNLDTDGASLLSLNILSKINSVEWEIRGARVYLELILGFSVGGGARKTANEMLDASERLLDMQKV